MLIDCPACARSYTVSREEIGAEGRTVICPRCEAQWFVEGDGPEAPAEDLRTTSISRRPIAEQDSPPASHPSVFHRIRPAVAAVTCVLAAMGLLGARERIVRFVPRTAGLYASIGLPVNVRGLEIVALASARPDEAPSDLSVSGEIRNVVQRRVGVPGLTYEIRDSAGAPLVTWTERANARTLGPGKTLAFVSAAHRLPPGAHSVLVRFGDVEAMPVRLAKREKSPRAGS